MWYISDLDTAAVLNNSNVSMHLLYKESYYLANYVTLQLGSVMNMAAVHVLLQLSPYLVVY